MSLDDASNVQQSVQKAYNEGRLRLGSTTQLSPSTGEALRATLENPSGSGLTFHIVAIVTTSTAGPVFAGLYENPTNGLPTTTRDIHDANRAVDSQTVGVLNADTGGTELSGGTDMNIEFGLEAGVTEKRNVLYTIPEGDTIGLNASGSTIVGESASMNIWYMVE